MEGYRVVYDERAHAYDRLPAARDEFNRKVRTLVGNFQLLRLIPTAIVPWRNPVWVQFLSHKIARLVVPWALVALFAGTLWNLSSGLFQVALALQIAFYAGGIAGLALGARCRWRVLSAAGSFLLLNGAAWAAFWVWLLRREDRTWRKVAYECGGPVVEPLGETEPSGR